MKKFLLVLVMAAVASVTALAAETKASFPGVDKAKAEFIGKTLVYPAAAAENGV